MKRIKLQQREDLDLDGMQSEKVRRPRLRPMRARVRTCVTLSRRDRGRNAASGNQRPRMCPGPRPRSFGRPAQPRGRQAPGARGTTTARGLCASTIWRRGGVLRGRRRGRGRGMPRVAAAMAAPPAMPMASDDGRDGDRGDRSCGVGSCHGRVRGGGERGGGRGGNHHGSEGRGCDCSGRSDGVPAENTAAAAAVGECRDISHLVWHPRRATTT